MNNTNTRSCEMSALRDAVSQLQTEGLKVGLIWKKNGAEIVADYKGKLLRIDSSMLVLTPDSSRVANEIKLCLEKQ